MKRTCHVALFVALVVVGCARDKPRVAKPRDPDKEKDVRKIDFDKDAKPGQPVQPPPPPVVDVLPSLPAMTAAEKREAALLRAIDLVAEKQYAKALDAFREAQKIEYTEPVEQEIIKVHALLAREGGADKAIEDVKVVLDEGKADQAAQLAGQALAQYGGGDKGGDLARLKQEADAVVTAAADDTAARRSALVNEAIRCVKDSNLRAAAVAIEQAVALKPDAELSAQLADLQERIATYDNSRRLAASLRKDTLRLSEALAHLNKARKAWDTLQVNEEIDEYTLLLERRRDRLAVTDFQVRGDVGVVAAGQAIAEELLPHFKSRFDLVERQQLAGVLDELKLESDDLIDNAAARRELQRRSRVRYLVVGSVTPMAGVTVHARLIEAATGLIVQTGRVSAPSVEALLPRLKELALILQMTDEQKRAFEVKLAQSYEVVKPVESAPLLRYDPVPEVPATPPLPIVTYTPRPPALGGVVIRDFFLPLVAAPPPPPATTLIIQGDRKHRLLRLCLELGDNLFRRGRYREADRHYGVALSLAGPRREISLRLDSCRKMLPPPAPPPVVVFQGRPVIAPPPPVRPRLAVFGFVPGDVKLVPAAMGDWAADSLAPYLGTRYELIDRGEACWYMGRLGITMADLLRDSGARVALARALNARFFVFGTIQPTASFDVATHLVDAETGTRTGTAAIHVKDQDELKLRASELAAQMGVKPDEQKEMAKQAQATEKAVNEVRQLLARDPKRAADVATEALKAAPNNVALLALREEAQRKNQLATFDAQRRDEAAQRAGALAKAKAQQEELARQAAAARLAAERAAPARDKAALDQQKAQKERGADQLRAQAKQAMTRGDPTRAVQLLQSAAALRPADDVYRELGEAKAAADKVRLTAVEAEQKKRETALAAQRDAALKRIEADRKAREKADADHRKAQEARDQGLHDGQMKQARSLYDKKDYEHALAAAQSARKVKPTAESARLIQQAQDALAHAAADAAEKKRLDDERKARQAAEEQAKKNQEAYLAALDKGRQLMLDKKYDEAAGHYQAALKLFKTDAALNGLKSAEQLRKQEQDAVAARKAAAAAEAKKVGQITDLLGQGKKALAAKQYARAKEAYRQVGKLSPGNVEALAGLSRAEREEGDELARVRREQAEKDRLKAFTGHLAAAKTALAKKNKAEAAKSLTEALKLYPDNAEAKKLLDDALAGSQQHEDYKLAMAAGQDALKKKLYKGAVNSFSEALKKKPDDAAAKAGLAEAQRLLKGEQDAAAYDAIMKKGKAAAEAKKYPEAIFAYDAALVVRPGDAAAIAGKKAAQAELDKIAGATKKETAYQAAMKEAKSAMDAKKYSEAAKAYDTALTNKPGDGAATTGKKAAEAELAKAADAGKREMAYQAAMKDAKAAMDAKKYAEAVKAYDTALSNKPGDAAATAGKKAAQTELTKAAEAGKRETAYQAAMKDAKVAMDGKKYPEALKAYDTALMNKPGDAAAIAGKKAAQAELDKPKTDPKLEEAKKKEAAYLAAMKDAKAAMDAKKYAEAAKAYDTALVNKPGDAAAIAGKRAALDAQKPPPKSDPKAEFTKAMQQGAALEKQKKNADAVTAYQAALKWANDLGDKPGQAQAYLGVARNEHAAKRFPEAVKAYEEVLKRAPNDAEAKAGLAKAKEKKAP